MKIRNPLREDLKGFQVNCCGGDVTAAEKEKRDRRFTSSPRQCPNPQFLMDLKKCGDESKFSQNKYSWSGRQSKSTTMTPLIGTWKALVSTSINKLLLLSSIITKLSYLHNNLHLLEGLQQNRNGMWHPLRKTPREKQTESPPDWITV